MPTIDSTNQQNAGDDRDSTSTNQNITQQQVLNNVIGRGRVSLLHIFLIYFGI
jgi:hypothetical protein